METNEELNNTLKQLSSAKGDPDEGLSKESLDLLLRNEELSDKRQDRELRKSYALKIFVSVCIFVPIVLLIVIINYFVLHRDTPISDGVLITLLTTTTADVLGLFAIVARYLFPNKWGKPSK